MPTNLPPECVEAEKRYRAAQTLPDRIRTLEEFLALIPKHKGTDKLRADLRARLSKMKSEGQAPKGPSRRDSTFRIPREGAGQVALVGPPNTGKSALVRALTKATPEVSDAPFTTWEPVPGMMSIEDIQVQLIDTPPLNPDYVEPELIELIRRADLMLLVVDLPADPLEQLQETVALPLENRVVPAPLHATHAVEIEALRTVIPTLVAANKCDGEDGDELFALFQALVADELEGEWPMVAVSATAGRHWGVFKQAVFEQLGIIRVYSKVPGKPPDMNAPFVLPAGGTVVDVAAEIHRDLLEKMKAARVWGAGVHDGQMVGREHQLHDGDIVELYT